MPERAPEIEQLVREWLEAKQAADAEGIRRPLSGYGGALAIGTGPGEIHEGAAGFHDAHTAGGPFAATIESVEAHRHGSAGWAAIRAVVDTGEPEGFPIRLTLVLVEEDGGWRIVQSHASTPDAG